jgi:PEGA domain
MPRPLRFAAALLALCPWACVAPDRPHGVVVASEPPGARILVDGVDSGWVTPMAMSLPRDERARIDLFLDGYRPATVAVAPDGQKYYLILWRESYKDWDTWRFPLWLNYEDVLAPIKLSRGLQPSRIFVPLRLAPPQ